MMIVLTIVMAYLLVLRGAISFFHPKFGALLSIVESIRDVEAMAWVRNHISSPTYQFLTRTIWLSDITFYSLLLGVVLLAIVLTKPKNTLDQE